MTIDHASHEVVADEEKRKMAPPGGESQAYITTYLVCFGSEPL